MRERAPRFSERIEDVLLAAAVGGAGLLGNRIAPRVGARLGRLGYWPFGVRRDRVEAHLGIAFPDRDPAWIRKTAAATYAHLGREAMNTLLAARNPGALLATVDFDGLDVLRQQLGTGHGVVLLGGHLGNWELGIGSLAQAGLPVSAVARRQRNPLFERRIVAVRRGFGIDLIRRGEAQQEALRGLRQNRIVLFVADQDARQAGVFVPFFNRPASTPRGPAVLARRAGAELAFMAPIRGLDGRLRVSIEPLAVPDETDSDGLTDRITAAYMAMLEKAVRAVPEQYLWHHRRWKTRPPEPAATEPETTRRP